MAETAHRPWALPQRPWAISMRWTDLLFAHWPVPAMEIARLIPGGFELDTFDGSAWIGVVPFRMEAVQLRGLPRLPGTALFPEANVRTYVRDRKSGDGGVYFFSLDAGNPLAVIAARGWYHLPYFFARMKIEQSSNGWWEYASERLFSSKPAVLRVRYRPKPGSTALERSRPGSLEYFLTERYALFTQSKRGQPRRADVHHRFWTLEPAEAEFGELSLASAQGIRLLAAEPVLHYSRSLEVVAWRPQVLR